MVYHARKVMTNSRDRMGDRIRHLETGSGWFCRPWGLCGSNHCRWWDAFLARGRGGDGVLGNGGLLVGALEDPVSWFAC
jgi:hypothetical protein